MAYAAFDWKFVVGMLAGFVAGLFYSVMLSPWFFENQFLIPIIVIFTVGFSVWYCKLPSLKSTTLAIIGSGLVFVLLHALIVHSENVQVRRTIQELRERAEQGPGRLR